MGVHHAGHDEIERDRYDAMSIVNMNDPESFTASIDGKTERVERTKCPDEDADKTKFMNLTNRLDSGIFYLLCIALVRNRDETEQNRKCVSTSFISPFHIFYPGIELMSIK